MIDDCTSLKMLFVIFVLCSKQVFAGEPILLKEALPVLVHKNSSIIVLGADHENSGLTTGVVELLKALRGSQTFNCLFLELPTDIQKELDAAVDKENLTIFSRAFLESKIGPTVEAYKKLGATDERLLEKVRQAFADHLRELSLKNMPVNNSVSFELIKFLKSSGIRGIAFDVASYSKEFQEASYYSVSDQNFGRTFERDIESMKISNQRSKLMSQNIQKMFKNYDCKYGLVVVGYAHLYSNDYFKKIYSTDISLTPVQSLLNENGIRTAMFLSEKKAGLDQSKIDLMSDPENRFDLFLGKLLNP